MRHLAACLCVLLLAVVFLPSCAPKADTASGPVASPPSPQAAASPVAVQRGATDKDLGIAFYPGVTVNKSGQVQGPKGAVAGAELETTQPYAGVVKFYREKYAAQKPAIQSLEDPAGPITMLNWQDLRGNYTVVIKRDEAGKRTVITLAKTSK